MARRAVVLGASGQLGVELVRVLQARGFEVTGWDRDQLDITNAAAVEARVAPLDPELVINSAAYNMVDVAEQEPHAAMEVNALAVRNVALACRQTDAFLVHYSTDYVFDGTAGRPYTEQDHPHPLGAYAVSKLTGEYFAQAYTDKVLVLRTSGVFGPGGVNTARGNFVETMLRLARGGKPIRVVEDHIASPTYAPALAEATGQLLDRKSAGLYHAGGGRAISWFEYAKLIFAAFGLSPDLQAVNSRTYRTAARRPAFSALANARMAAEGIAPMPPLEECLADYRKRRP